MFIDDAVAVAEMFEEVRTLPHLACNVHDFTFDRYSDRVQSDLSTARKVAFDVDLPARLFFPTLVPESRKE